jgi:hypothetical protein
LSSLFSGLYLRPTSRNGLWNLTPYLFTIYMSKKRNNDYLKIILM